MAIKEGSKVRIIKVFQESEIKTHLNRVAYLRKIVNTFNGQMVSLVFSKDDILCDENQIQGERYFCSPSMIKEDKSEETKNV